MKKNAKARMAKRRTRFVVGYIGAGNIVFGRRSDPRKEEFGFTDACEPLTMAQAKRLLAGMPCSDCAIFELVPVEVNR